jgi:hypothetical protein
MLLVAALLPWEANACQFALGSAGMEAALAAARRDELESLCMQAKGWSRSR